MHDLRTKFARFALIEDKMRFVHKQQKLCIEVQRLKNFKSLIYSTIKNTIRTNALLHYFLPINWNHSIIVKT